MPNKNDPDDLSGLPQDPNPGDLPALYKQCREKLVSANRSRSSLKGHDTRRSILITQLQQQLNEIESSLHDEALSRLRVHELNSRVAEIVRELEVGIDEAASIVEEKGATGLTSWVIRFAKLLPVVLRIREAKSAARRILGRDSDIEEPVILESQAESQRIGDGEKPGVSEAIGLLAPTQVESFSLSAASLDDPDNSHELKDNANRFGSFILKDLTDAYGLLLLHHDGELVPDGWCITSESLWLLGEPLLALQNPEDASDAPVEAALEALSENTALFPSLKSWFDVGILPFARDQKLQQLRLLSLDAIDDATHVLVTQQLATRFEDVEAAPLSLDLDDDIWSGYALSYTEEKEVLRSLLQRPGQSLHANPRLSTRGGVRMTEGQGYLATGLGLPLLGIPLGTKPEQVVLNLSDGTALTYQPLQVDDQNIQRILYQPSQGDRRRSALVPGSARFVVRQQEDPDLEQSIQLTTLPLDIEFYRGSALDFREDWGLTLGSLVLPDQEHTYQSPDESAQRWARQRLNQGDLRVNPLFEQQMLESLCALFQRRASIQRREFFMLYSQLRNKPDEWPGFPEAVLRGWCEGGWIEEGMERGKGRWRIQPVDPRLVRIRENAVQLVGLLTARRLVDVVAWAHQLELKVQTVPPSCPDMPRGWRFLGDIEGLASASSLPLINLEDWVPDPRGHNWIIEDPLPSDSPPWPTGSGVRRTRDAVCGRRGLDRHWMPKERFPERGRAPISQTIQVETSQYGKRRWLSYDPVSNAWFSSCHRNRVAMHALIVATDGLWPFGFTDLETGQLDRLYDAEAYLPLPLGRYAALFGSKMPGPTRYQPQDHTYRYFLDRNFRLYQAEKRILPLTSLPTSG